MTKSNREPVIAAPGSHGIDVAALALAVAGANSGLELAAVLGGALDTAFDLGVAYATRENLWQSDAFDVLTADNVEFKSDATGKVWLNVSGKLVFRAAFAGVVNVEVHRSDDHIRRVVTDYEPVPVVSAVDEILKK